MCKLKSLDGQNQRDNAAGRTAFVINASKYAADNNVSDNSTFAYGNSGEAFTVLVNDDSRLHIRRDTTGQIFHWAKGGAAVEPMTAPVQAAPVAPTNTNGQTDLASTIAAAVAQSLQGFQMPQQEPTINRGEIAAVVEEIASDLITQAFEKQYTHKLQINQAPAIEIKGEVHDKFKTVLFAIQSGMIPYIYGPAGTGKNVLAEQVAKAMGLEFYYAGALQQKYELEGFKSADGTYQETPLYQAMKNGGVFMFDEIDSTSAEVLVAFNAVMANNYHTFPDGSGKKLQAHPDFHIIVAGNTSGHGADDAYNGRFQLDASTLDRFSPIKLDYCEKIELACANGDRELVDFAHMMRKSFEVAGLPYTFSTRALKRIAQYIGGGFTVIEALEYGLCGGWAPTDIRMIQGTLDTSNKYAKIFTMWEVK